MRDQMGPDFIEALARGLDVIRAFESGRPTMSLSEVAAAAGLARPTARRILLTLEELGYVRSADGLFALTPRVLELGMAYIGSSSIWEIARPHMERLVARTGESSSLAQLDGSDIVYVARVAVPKVVTFAVAIGTRFPALQTSLGKVLLAALTPDELTRTLAEPSRSGVMPRWNPAAQERDCALHEARPGGFSLARPFGSIPSHADDSDANCCVTARRTPGWPSTGNSRVRTETDFDPQELGRPNEHPRSDHRRRAG